MGNSYLSSVRSLINLQFMLNAIYFYRIARWLYLHHVPFLPKLITLLIFLIYNSKVPYQAHIGKGTKFGYGGVGVIIHSKAWIGDYVSIGQQVTIGEVILNTRAFPRYATIRAFAKVPSSSVAFAWVRTPL